MAKINLAITGCLGRMGRQLIKTAVKDRSVKIVSLTENTFLNKKISGIYLEKNKISYYWMYGANGPATY